MSSQPTNSSSRRGKFAYAFRGVGVAIGGQRSFAVHVPAAIAVVIAGWLLEVSRTEWSLLMFCITLVFAAELFNTALEHLARAITLEEHANIRDGLDVAAGAVLVVAAGASAVGLIVLGTRLVEWLS